MIYEALISNDRENIADKMLERINLKIKYAKDNYNGWNESSALRLEEIRGMVEMLSIVTGKHYVVTEFGLEEIE